jgi:arylsulfatase A-like enzyme
MRRSVTAVLLLLPVVGCDTSSTGPIPGRPNLVFILVDDFDVASLPYLPRLQSLAEAGVYFENSFVSYSSCAPSRASILRGQYAHNHAVISNDLPRGGFQHWHELGRGNSTVATWLQGSGYRTGFFGKYLNLYPAGAAEGYVPPGWTEWYGSLASHYYDFRVNENGTPTDYPCCEVYETDLLATRAADFIRRRGSGPHPLFLYIAPFAPHKPAAPASRHAGEFAGLQAPRPPSFNEADVSDKPHHLRVSLLTDPEIAEIDELFRERLRSMRAVEELIDSVVAALESVDRRDKTYLFFYSDNGFHLGQHRLGATKLTAFDEDIRVPLLVSGPGIRGGRTVGATVVNHDIAPTLAELAGALPAHEIDGRSFAPQLFGIRGASGRRGFLVERWRVEPNQPDLLPGYRALRTSDYLYVEWDTGEFELYDRGVDPYEMENIYTAADPGFLSELTAWADRLGSCAGRGCIAVEDEDPPGLRLMTSAAAGASRR